MRTSAPPFPTVAIYPRSNDEDDLHMMDFNYPAILQLFPEHLDPRRSESAAFLIWYLEKLLSSRFTGSGRLSV